MKTIVYILFITCLHLMFIKDNGTWFIRKIGGGWWELLFMAVFLMTGFMIAFSALWGMYNFRMEGFLGL